MKHQVLCSLKNNKKNLRMSSAAVVISALRVKVNWCIQMEYNSNLLFYFPHSQAKHEIQFCFDLLQNIEIF